MNKTNYSETAETMRTSLAALPGWTVGEMVADASGWSFTVARAASETRRGRKIDRVPGFCDTRHIGTDGTLTVTRHG